MNFKISKRIFLNALQLVARAVSSNSPIPSLSGIKLDIENDRIILTGSDSDISIKKELINDEDLKLDVIQTGSMVIDSRYLLEIVKRIDPAKGTMFAQNVTFERSRLKELAYIFPEYKEQLLKIVERSTDLLYFIKNNQSIYEELGFDEERSKLVNFYHKNLSGSYSIKKTLPVLSDLTYKNLEVKNGTEALVTYSLYDDMTPDELERAKKNLRVYCKQDTWAMVVILDALRNLVKNDK